MVCFACLRIGGNASYLRGPWAIMRGLFHFTITDFLEQLDAECRARARVMNSIRSVLRVTVRESSTRPRKVAANIAQVTVSSALPAVLTSSVA
jgi:hypothetical protein